MKAALLCYVRLPSRECLRYLCTLDIVAGKNSFVLLYVNNVLHIGAKLI